MISQHKQMMTPFEKAIHHENAGEYDKAAELLRQCLSERGHDEGEIYFYLGWCLEQDPKGDRAAVVSSYEQAAVKASEVLMRVNAFFRSGWVLLHEREYERAAGSFRRAVDLAARSSLRHDLVHQAIHWSAVCLEQTGQYLEAAACYARVQGLSPLLAPESSYREILCRNQVGQYAEALAVCRSFPGAAPEGFDAARYSELFAKVRQEEALLARCLAEEGPAVPEGNAR